MNLSPSRYTLCNFVPRLLDKTNTSSNLELAHWFLWLISASWWMGAGHYLLLLLLESHLFRDGILYNIRFFSCLLFYDFLFYKIS
jgi:hypothetical protein